MVQRATPMDNALDRLVIVGNSRQKEGNLEHSIHDR